VRSGLTSAAAAEALGVSTATVDTHIQSAMTKLGARSRVQAALLAERFDHRGGGETLPAEDRDILALVAQGYRVREIAQMAHLSPRTVDRRLAHAREVLGVETTTEALSLVFGRAPVRTE
jgi:DNA-binding NarL/FixJ family response regulator